jgi:hypothetical protein
MSVRVVTGRCNHNWISHRHPTVCEAAVGERRTRRSKLTPSDPPLPLATVGGRPRLAGEREPFFKRRFLSNKGTGNTDTEGKPNQGCNATQVAAALAKQRSAGGSRAPPSSAAKCARSLSRSGLSRGTGPSAGRGWAGGDNAHPLSTVRCLKRRWLVQAARLPRHDSQPPVRPSSLRACTAVRLAVQADRLPCA